MKLHILFLKKILPLGLSIILIANSLTGCQKNGTNTPTENDISSESELENSTFESFTKDLFFEEIAANTINLHFSVENPADLGISDYEISLGDFSKESRDSSSTYLKETLSEVLSYNYDLLSDNSVFK